jgi:hypothetical protein
MLDRTNWRHDGLGRFISRLEAQPENAYQWDDCEDCLFARYARTLGVQLGEAWHSLHPDGRIAMELYCHIGAGDHGGRQSYVDALARAKNWQERPMLVEDRASLLITLDQKSDRETTGTGFQPRASGSH